VDIGVGFAPGQCDTLDEMTPKEQAKDEKRVNPMKAFLVELPE